MTTVSPQLPSGVSLGQPTSASDPSPAPVQQSSAIGVVMAGGDVLGGVYERSGPSGSFTDTTSSAASIVAALVDPTVNAAIPLLVINEGGGTMSIAPGSNVTLAGILSAGAFDISTNATRMFMVVPTAVTAGAEAVTIYG